MAKLNQIIALIPGKKNRGKEVMERTYHIYQKPAMFEGIARKYAPKEEGGDALPSEQHMPQMKVADLVRDVRAAVGDLLDVVATQDAANCTAKASIVIDGKVLLADVPVTHLLFLEKQ